MFIDSEARRRGMTRKTYITHYMDGAAYRCEGGIANHSPAAPLSNICVISSSSSPMISERT